MRFFVPYMQLPLPGKLREPYGSLQAIKAAGWDGVEIHLIGSLRSLPALATAVGEATELGLEYRFHQGWSWRTGQRNFANVLLKLLGALVPDDETLQEQTRNAMAFGGPVVVYGNHLVGAPEGNLPGCIFQTASEHVDGHAYAMSYDEFVSRLPAAPKAGIAFDTQHYLEWVNNLETVEGLPNMLRSPGQFQQFWNEFGHQVVELHWNDADPSRGRDRGRNVIPGRGGIPLHEMARIVRKSGWNGIVVPEVNRIYLGSRLSTQIGLPGLRMLMNTYF